MAAYERMNASQHIAVPQQLAICRQPPCLHTDTDTDESNPALKMRAVQRRLMGPTVPQKIREKARQFTKK
eukprot:4141108-Karenia_brevis.AAC.1